ncbi:MAG: hypothetical protein KC680_04215 [Candidatus Peregrinibacteria bacterium]|nr:hypothetical protein [Candidatus Peregrinibacteria bacterium]MCB9808586.1 hypothetical protein [Candidatus Peribacteria bacterium]
MSVFPELIELIKHSESMNDEERQYWINILPVMTPEQIDNLQSILENEKKQLAEIDKRYAAGSDVQKTGEERRKRREERQEEELTAEEAEERQTEDLLLKIEEL